MYIHTDIRMNGLRDSSKLIKSFGIHVILGLRTEDSHWHERKLCNLSHHSFLIFEFNLMQIIKTTSPRVHE